MWDKIYDDRGNNRTRALNKALKRNDSNDHLVTYDKLTVMGMINTTQDLLGYHFIKLGDPHIEGAQIEGSTFITVTLNPDHNIDFYDKTEHAIDSYEETYDALDCLFYTQDETGRIDYYQYAYDPEFQVPPHRRRHTRAHTRSASAPRTSDVLRFCRPLLPEYETSDHFLSFPLSYTENMN
jgi:hypothetical protein